MAAGASFSASLKKYPLTFPGTYIALVRSAEQTGHLSDVMEQLSVWLERRDRLNQMVKKALTYPIFVASLTAMLTLALFRTVIPAILKTVLDLGVQLPWPTRVLLMIVEAIRTPWVWLVAIVLLAGTVRYLRTPAGYRKALTLCCALPGLGSVLIWSASSRFANTMAMLVESGVDLVNACRVSAAASGLPLVEEDCHRVIREISRGEPLSVVLSSSSLYPTMLTALIAVGEEAGDLGALLRRSALLLEEDAADRVQAFTNLLEPLVLGFLSVGVGFIVIALMLPMSNTVSAL